ncbi:uncharacterized protein TRAVEDRAFT_47982 [Trametes versicolor FP-101664 SS1]|uniref:uncharacterized protein n=1 Tax=Trametes versicolor (strain FP-101664) TaxID=717944 RepID=UPI000462231E|nr:uncharacterized protein TRAVEDRAFT_47982 [Trametes versicolor FP-101664 SS1]EIW58840.1 hypothetical protein TRAVEDRAFT_47982 [Trametes versicolor FP-101664 SS1]
MAGSNRQAGDASCPGRDASCTRTQSIASGMSGTPDGSACELVSGAGVCRTLETTYPPPDARH